VARRLYFSQNLEAVFFFTIFSKNIR